MAINPELIDLVKLNELPSGAFDLLNLIAQSNPSGLMTKGTQADFAAFIAPYVAAIGSSGYVNVASNTLPNPAGTNSFSFVSAGTYSQTGEPDLVATGTFNIIYWNGTTWTLTKAINLDLSGYVTTTDFNSLKNTVNSNVMIDGDAVGFYPVAQNSGLHTVENYPYSKGEAFLLNSGEQFPGNAAIFVLTYLGSNLDIPSLAGKKITIEIINDTPSWFSGGVMDSILVVTKQDNTTININPTSTTILSPTSTRFYYERTISVTDKSFEAFWRIYSNAVAPSDSYFKTKSVKFFIDGVLYSPLDVSNYQDSLISTKTNIFPLALNGATLNGDKIINIASGQTGSGSKFIVDLQRIIPSYIDNFSSQKVEISFKIATKNIPISYLTLSFNSEQTIGGIVTTNHTDRLSFQLEQKGGFNYALVRGVVSFPSNTDKAYVSVQLLNSDTSNDKYLELIDVELRIITEDGSLKNKFKNLVVKNNNLPNGTVDLSEFKDTFSGFNADGFNEGSAVYKAFRIFEFKNFTALIGDAYPFKPVMVDSAYFDGLSNVKLIGNKMPSFKDGMVEMTGGSIIQGCFLVVQTVNDFHIENIGFDAMKNVSDAYYGSAETEGFVISYPSGTTEPWGRNFYAKNIITGVRSPYGAKHTFLIERVKGVYIENVYGAFGQHGITIKSRDVVAIGCGGYGQSSENLIIKAGELTTNTGNIYISDFVGDRLPPNVTNSFFNIPKAAMGCFLDAQIDLKNISIGSLSIKYATIPLHLKPLTSDVNIENVQINSLYCSDGDVGIGRTGSGTVKNVNIGSAIIKNMLTFALDFEGSSGLDSGINIEHLIYRRDAGTTAAAVYMNNGTNLRIGTLDVDNVTDALTISLGCHLILDNYIKGNSVTNYKTALTSNPITKSPVINQNDIIDSLIKGIDYVSDNGTKYRITIDNSGDFVKTVI